MVIIFSSEKARAHLLVKGLVYSARVKKRKQEGRDWMTDKRCGKKIRDVHTTYMGKKMLLGAYWEGLSPFAPDSGFGVISKWRDEIQRLAGRPISDNEPLHLYKVQLRVDVPCPRCDGEGDIPESEFAWIRCPRCEGRKKIMQLGVS